MAYNTKLNLSNRKFEQNSGDTLNLSGNTNIYGQLIFESGSTFSIKPNAGLGKIFTSDSGGTGSWQEFSSNGITGVTNLGTGTTIGSKSGNTLNLNTLKGSGNTTVLKIGNEIVIATVDSIEIASRTIYVSTTGSDTTGIGLIGAPFRNILRALQDIKDIVQNSTITISLGGTGNFPMTYAEMYELAKKSFVNSTLSFLGTDFTTIESGFTVSKTALRCFAYTLTKSGLTVTENQYRGYFMSTGSAWYPIAGNAAGTTAFDVEYVHNNLTTPTNIIEWGATITNPSNLNYILDFGFKKSSNSSITFDNLNIDGGTVNKLIFIDLTPKRIGSCKLNVKSIDLGNGYNTGVIRFNINSCFINQNIASSYLITIFANSIISSAYSVLFALYSTSNGIIYCRQADNIQLVSGNYIIGNNTVAGFLSEQYFRVIIRDFIKIKNVSSLAYAYRNSNFIKTNTAPYWEFENVPYLLSAIPSSDFNLSINNLYGTLPPAYNVSSGYKFIDEKNNIHISAPGIYGEKEPGVIATLVNNSSGTTQVGDTAQNKSIFIKYSITRGTSREEGTIWIDNKSDTNISIKSEFDDCGVTFGKQISSNVINLTWATTNTGTAATFNYQIERIMV